MLDRKSRLAGAAMVVAAAVAFSGKAILVKLAYRHGVDPLTLLCLRMAFSAPLFGLVAWWALRSEATQPLTAPDIRATFALGLVGYYAASYFNFLGLQHVTAALERVLLFVHPTFVVLMSAFLFKRRITRRDVVAIVLSYLGIGLVFGNDLFTQQGNVVLGSAWVLLSAMLYASYLIGSGQLVARVGSLRFASYAGLASCAGVIVHFLIAAPDPRVLFSQPLPVFGLAFVMAAVSTVLPLVLMTEGIRRVGSSHAALISSIGPIATIGLGFIFLGEAITAVQILGAMLVMAGVLAISVQKPKV